MLNEVSKLPPKERMGTLIPEFPKGLSGISPALWEAFAGRQKGAITDPAPAIPAAFKNSLRARLGFLMGISDSLKKFEF
jgi:hypothetical protein